MKELILEQNEKALAQAVIAGGAVLITPNIDEDYWLLRVRVSDSQSLVLFPKFGTYGIGFAIEEDWNSNLPYTIEAESIYDHISRNKGDDAISKEDCIQSICLLQEGIRQFLSHNK